MNNDDIQKLQLDYQHTTDQFKMLGLGLGTYISL